MSSQTPSAKPGPQWEAARMPNGDVYLRRVGGGAARLVTAAEVAAIVAAEGTKPVGNDISPRGRGCAISG